MLVPTEADIRARVLGAGHQVAVPVQVPVSGLCADPGSGQNPGFAHRPEVKEDPQLLRTPIDSAKLREHFQNLNLGTSELKLTKRFYRRKFVDRVEIAPVDWKPRLSQQIPNYKFQVVIQQIKRTSVQVISLAFAILGELLALKNKLAQVKITLPQLILPTIVLPKIVLPKVTIPKFSLPKIRINLPEINWRAVMGFTGQGLIIGSIVILLLTVGPIIRLQAGDWWNASRTAITGKAIEPQIKEVLTDTVRKPEEVPPEDKQFQLLIPKLNANMKVIANVDAGDEIVYTQALKQGVAHAAGSGLPGEPNETNKSIYIFGHSTNTVFNIAKYNALFYSLKDLVPGDEIIVWFWGKEYRYKVEQMVKVDPLDLSYLMPQTKKDQLILQTCWPPGTTWKRLLVIATPVKE